MKLRTVLKAFIDHKRGVAGCLPNTIESYEGSIGLFIDYVSVEVGDANLAEFSAENIEGWLAKMEKRGRSRATMATRLSALRELAKYGVRKRYWDHDPTVEIPFIRRPRSLPRPFSPAEREALMALPLDGADAVLRALLYFTGMRESEVCHVRVGDTKGPGFTDEGPTLAYVRVTGKGAKERIVKLHPECWRIIDAYVSKKETEDRLPDSWLLTQRDSGRPWSAVMIQDRCKKWGKAAGVVRCTPHRWRHTFATDLLEGGADLRVVQDSLGHASPATTAIYTKIVDKRKDAAILRLPGFARAAMPSDNTSGETTAEKADETGRNSPFLG